jgi:hypothetical protein
MLDLPQLALYFTAALGFCQISGQLAESVPSG